MSPHPHTSGWVPRPAASMYGQCLACQPSDPCYEHTFRVGDEVTVPSGDIGKVVAFASSSGAVLMVDVYGFVELWAARQLTLHGPRSDD